MAELTHFDEHGRAHMVDVSAKDVTARVAIAQGRIWMADATLERVRAGSMGKGDVLGVAELAGIMGAKRTSDLIPLCHPLPLTNVSVSLRVETDSVVIEATTKTTGKTGVEMEALTAVSVAALTVYDMCKAIDKAMRIGDIELVHKSGGKSGTYNKAG